ncbi:MAG: hypothetical protein RL338_1240 [Chloroflexota bacterium]
MTRRPTPRDLLDRMTGRRADPAADTIDEAWLAGLVAAAHPVDAERIARVRERILIAGRVAATEAAAAPADGRIHLGRRPDASGGRIHAGRRAAILALGLTVATVGSVAGAESGPGEAFYDARLAVESLALPPDDTPEGVAARLALLDRRLAEATEASERGDDAAATAALGAYRSRLGELFPGAGAGAVDLAAVAIPGIELAAVERRLSAGGGLLERIGRGLRADPARARLLDDVSRIRSAIAERVARDDAARENAGSGSGLGPRPSPARGGGVKPKASPTPTPKGKRKGPARPAATATPRPTVTPAP